jgi:anaerobic magnesium-protoporphyrin IX monomethyl ester cyclase
VIGEGEITLVEVLDRLASSGDVAGLPGICTRDARGSIHRAPRREIVRDLDALPRPAWDLVDVERYRAVWKRHGYFSMNVATTRGCPYHCNWCAKPIYGQRYTVRSPEHVVEEIAWLGHNYRPDHLWMADDIFGLKPGWIERFAELMRERDAAVPFKCLLRADQVTRATAAALRQSGCRTAWIGAESGSQRVLDAMEKGIRVEQIGDASRWLHEAGIDVGFFLQFGYPGETREDIEQTLQLVRDCRPDDIGVSVSYPLPGTPFFDRVRATLGQKQNWVDSNDLDTMFQATYTPEFYRALHSLVHAEFRARRARSTVGFLRHRLAMPVWRWRLERLARRSAPQPTRVPLTVLTPQAAAVPTDQASVRYSDDR